eukprot:07644.XXX_100062_100211_1 [CDS] Oithona nana genome sequencing.
MKINFGFNRIGHNMSQASPRNWVLPFQRLFLQLEEVQQSSLVTPFGKST